MRTLYVVGLMAGIVFTLAAEYTAKCRRDHLSLVRQRWRPDERRPKLRVHIAGAMRVDPRRQWRLLHSESRLPAISAAADVCAAYPAMMS